MCHHCDKTQLTYTHTHTYTYNLLKDSYQQRFKNDTTLCGSNSGYRQQLSSLALHNFKVLLRQPIFRSKFYTYCNHQIWPKLRKFCCGTASESSNKWRFVIIYIRNPDKCAPWKRPLILEQLNTCRILLTESHAAGKSEVMLACFSEEFGIKK